jgi:signal transduction histidine kinase
VDVDISEKSALIVFEDNGIGVSHDLIDKIFDMFFRATERSEGAGLGLYIVKETIEKLMGTIVVTSTVGQGVKFIMEIPNGLEIINFENSLITPR